MTKMFFTASAFNQNIRKWNVGKTTTLTNMFLNAPQFLKDQNNNNLINAEGTPQLTYFIHIFMPATKAELQDAVSGYPTNKMDKGDMNTWNVSQVTDMNMLFANKTTFNENISDWDVSNVTNMNQMFAGATRFNQNIGKWNT